MHPLHAFLPSNRKNSVVLRERKYLSIAGIKSRFIGGRCIVLLRYSYAVLIGGRCGNGVGSGDKVELIELVLAKCACLIEELRSGYLSLLQTVSPR